MPYTSAARKLLTSAIECYTVQFYIRLYEKIKNRTDLNKYNMKPITLCKFLL